jgi:hypothetical protein
MNLQNKVKSLTHFQSNSFKTYKTLGFNADNANVVFGIIIEMRNLICAAESQDTILLHKHMGICASFVANYATINSLKLSSVFGDYSHYEMEDITSTVDLEYYLTKIKDDLSFVKDMKEDDKKEFIQKCWVCIFPDEYHDDFIKIDRILSANIEDNKIKYPKSFEPITRTE